MTPHILIVDDDSMIQSMLVFLMKNEGYKASSAMNGAEMHALINKEKFDLIILDLGLPDEDGMVLARQLRARSNIPIIVLTSNQNKDVLLNTLEIGVDDFISKPFEPRELVLRINNTLSRADKDSLSSSSKKPSLFQFDGWTLDLDGRSLSDPDQRLIDLTPGEFNILATLTASPSRALSRDVLLDAVTQSGDAPLPRMIDVYVNQLRKKIEADPRQPKLIRTVRGFGYKFGGNLT